MLICIYGNFDLRIVNEVQSFNGLFAPFAWKKVNKRPSNSDNHQNIRLVDKRILPKEVSQEGQKAWSENKEKECLNNIRYPYIIHLVRRTYGKR